jgi:hypothetical protein
MKTLEELKAEVAALEAKAAEEAREARRSMTQ